MTRWPPAVGYVVRIGRRLYGHRILMREATARANAERLGGRVVPVYLIHDSLLVARPRTEDVG